MTGTECAEKCHKVKEELKQLEGQVRQNPMQSVLLAFAAGVAITSLLGKR